MVIYVVECVKDGSEPRVSQEGYLTLADAQRFIKSRSGEPQKLTEYVYKTQDFTYTIYDVHIDERDG